MERDDNVSLSDVVRRSLPCRHDIKAFGESTFKTGSFLFLLGMWQEAKRRFNNDLTLVCSGLSEGRFYEDMYLGAFDELPGNKPYSSHRMPRGRKIRFYSEQVIEVAKELTGDNTHPPDLLLDSSEKRITYLKGFLYRGAKVSYQSVRRKTAKVLLRWPRVSFNYSESKQNLMEGVYRLLDRFSIKLAKGARGFSVKSVPSLRKLLDLNLLCYDASCKLTKLLRRFDEFWDVASVDEGALISYHNARGKCRDRRIRLMSERKV